MNFLTPSIRSVERFIVCRSPRNNCDNVNQFRCSSQLFCLLMGRQEREEESNEALSHADVIERA